MLFVVNHVKLIGLVSLFILVLTTTATVRCQMDFKNFPFDYQFCTLDFHLVDYSLRHINLKWSQRFKDKVVLISEFNLGDLKPTNKYITIRVSLIQYVTYNMWRAFVLLNCIYTRWHEHHLSRAWQQCISDEVVLGQEFYARLKIQLFHIEIYIEIFFEFKNSTVKKSSAKSDTICCMVYSHQWFVLLCHGLDFGLSFLFHLLALVSV